MILWGFDLGGTKIECVVIQYIETTAHAPVEILFRDRLPTEAHKGYAHIMNQIDALLQLGKKTTGESPLSVGIGTPGILDRTTLKMKNANVTCLNEQNIAKDLEERWDIPVYHTNDANAFILAETLVGAGRKRLEMPRASFGIIIGTGVGGGWMLDGKLHEGPHGIAGEWGHTTVGTSYTKCYCGKTGCLETFISGGALEKFYASLTGVKKTLPDIYQDFIATQDMAAKITLDRLVLYLGKAIAQVINTIDPDMIIVGGGVSQMDYIYEQLPSAILPQLFNHELNTPILKHTLGESAGVIGAALLSKK